MIEKILKMIFITIIIVGIALSCLNFINIDTTAKQLDSIGTMHDEFCVGEPLNC